MKSWLAVSAIVLATLTFPTQAAAPVAKWAEGDRWEVQLEQLPLHLGSGSGDWRPSFRLQFAVTDRSPREVRVEVTTIPENRFQERLVLRYTPKGELLSAQIVDPKRVQELGPAGGAGVFGMLGREAFVMTKAPEAEKNRSVSGATVAALAPVKVAVDKEGRCQQTWRPGDLYWVQYETRAGLPQRARRIDASFRSLGAR